MPTRFACLLLPLIALPAAAQDDIMTLRQFDQGLADRRVFESFDANADGAIDGMEFSAGLFDGYDADDDDILNTPEYDAMIGDGRWNRPDWPADLAPWDLDGDGVLLRDEFRDGLSKLPPFFLMDTDGDQLLSRPELVLGLWTVYDTDKDGVIRNSELGKVGDDMGRGGFFDD